MAKAAPFRNENATTAGVQAVAAGPAKASWYCELALAERRSGRMEAAMLASAAAVRLDPHSAEGHHGLGIAQYRTGRIAEAIASLRAALALKPDWPAAHSNLGLALEQLGDLGAALVAHDRAVIARGGGWEDYEHRWVLWQRAVRFKQPMWSGETLNGRTLLLHAEQGFGDAIQFVRYAPLIRPDGPIVLEVQPELRRLFAAALPPHIAIVARGETLPHIDVQIPMLSLPRVFGTRLGTIPATVPYLRPPASAAGLADRAGLQVAIVWAGSPSHPRDAERSLRLADLAPVLAVSGCVFHSLQLGPAREQLNEAPFAGIVDHAPRLTDFADAAAVLAAADLTIVADTAAAHLAGAMGKPVWVLVPFCPDWRWLTDREDTPWYPTMHLFRQPCRGDWAGAVARVAAELGHRAAQ